MASVRMKNTTRAEMQLLKKQNQALLARLLVLEKSEKKNAELAQNAGIIAETPPTPAPSLRRSPRRSPKKTPKRKSAIKTPRDGKKSRTTSITRKRTPSTPQAKKIRKTLGDTFKAAYDDQVQRGLFVDCNSNFKKDLYEDCVRPIIEAMMDDPELNTDGFDFYDIFKMGLDVVKKRGKYKKVYVLH